MSNKNLSLDYSKLLKAEAVPEASSMIETFRAIGYNIETAVVDIIDNSISASAKNVWINFEWKGPDSWISIKDDGHGMDNDELIQAMRPGSKNPLDVRDTKDLGRFGLGLKTASFSQCRQLSVISKRLNSEAVYWTWDLDYVKDSGRWELIKYYPETSVKEEINNLDSGTIVLWNLIDRVVSKFDANNKGDHDKFLIIMERVKKHIAMVFHRFVEAGRITVHFQDRLIEAWDPFLRSELTTQSFPKEPLLNGKIYIKGYILPHKSKISEFTFRKAEGPKGWNEQQGFYIYRNERLLLAGDWLGLFRKEEHYKLARIQIDLPNSLDAEWQIDIKKSVARPPHGLLEQIKAYAVNIRSQAVEVYRHRGKQINPLPWQKFVPLWLDHKRGDKWFFKVNRKHPVIEEIKKQSKDKPEKSIESLLKLIEETIPTKSIYIKESEIPEAQGKPYEGLASEDILALMRPLYSSFIEQGKSIDEARAAILNIEPFNYYPELIFNI